MNWFNKDKERERFYLLPGMGGRARHRKQKMMLCWGIAIGLVASGVFVALMYWVNTWWLR